MSDLRLEIEKLISKNIRSLESEKIRLKESNSTQHLYNVFIFVHFTKFVHCHNYWIL